MFLLLPRHHIRRLCSTSAVACAALWGPELPQGSLFNNTQSPHVSELIHVNLELKELVKTGRLKDARELFDKMPQRDEISWTTLISGYAKATDYREALGLFRVMRRDSSMRMDPFVLGSVLKACGLDNNLNFGEVVHGSSVKTGLSNSVYVGSALLDMYTKTGNISVSCRVFDEMPERNVVSWTAMIAGLVNSGYAYEGLMYFSEMWRSKLHCDSYTFSSALKGCYYLSDLDHGREIHAQTIKKGFDSVSFIANTLISMYNNCGKFDSGFHLFRNMRKPDVVSWTTIITTFVRAGELENAIQEFLRMRESSVSPNEYTLASVISCCANMGVLSWGEQLHGYLLRLGLGHSPSVANSIMDLYSKCGELRTASLIFNAMTYRDIVSWSTIISGFAQGEYDEEAFKYLSWMRKEGTDPNEFTLASMLSVCGNVAIFVEGRQLHAHVQKAGLENESMVHSALINMYCKCGSLKEASKVFKSSSHNDIVSWTAMINGYAEHGRSQEAIELFQKMPQAGWKPDSVTFMGVLTACSHAGLVELGFYYFDSMASQYHITPSKEHYGCMIDLLCRAGRLAEAEDMINTMPHEWNDVVWSTLLRACAVFGNVECGRRAADKILELNPNCAGTHITLANIYSLKGKWREAADIRKLMRSKGLEKERGSSWIKVKDQVASFVSRDKTHPECESVYAVLDLLVSGTDATLDDVDTLLCDG
ncbi:hypothetical protein Dimus_002856 [Dionaea muscipula]